MLAGPTIAFIVCHSVLFSQPVNGETFILSLESIRHDLSHIHMCASDTNWQVILNKSLNVYLIFIIIYEQFFK